MILIFLYSHLFSIVGELSSQDFSRYSELQGASQNIVVFSALMIVSFILSSIAVPLWFFRANQNLHLSGLQPEYTSGWAAGWFFIPFANLVVPIKVMNEIWKGTQHLANPSESNWKNKATTFIIPLWWIFYIVSGFFSNVSNRMIDDFDRGFSMNNLNNALIMQIIAFALFFVSALFLLRVVSKVTKTQESIRSSF